MEIKKSPNNPYSINNLSEIKFIYPDMPITITLNDMYNWYLEQIYQIELELKGQLTYDYRQYLQKKYMYLRTGLLCIYCQKNENKSL